LGRCILSLTQNQKYDSIKIQGGHKGQLDSTDGDTLQRVRLPLAF